MLAGAAYLPLDPAHPPARVTALLERARAVAVIAPPDLLAGLDAYPGTKLPPPAPPAGPHGPDVAGGNLRPGDPAYVIFTSGPTGEPKGAVGPHGAVVEVNLLFGDANGFGRSEER